MPVGIRTEALRKVFPGAPPIGEVVALDGLSLEVRAGEIFGLLGPNGAGKSTTVGVLTTRVRPTSGRAWIGEHDVWQRGVEVKRLIGVVPQRPNLDFALTAREILTFHGAYFGIPSATRKQRADELLEQFKLTDRAHQKPLGFSGGMMQRLSIARAMMHDPEVLFLDEPSAGLDPQTRLLLTEMIRAYNARGKTILLTTHNMEEADALCHRLAIVDHGKVIAEGEPRELKRAIPGGFVVRVHLESTPDGLVDALRRLDGVSEVRATDSGPIQIYADRGGPLVPAVVSTASSAGATIRDLNISEPSLENLFLHHTGRSLRE
ncbi:MAG TPA: ATP-binding cassette domain-containing protein [Thermoanaerobaculia bacterium]|nr:ATP-binding cassette domain-containing protein [Thermoanaerobaculia bacterium]